MRSCSRRDRVQVFNSTQSAGVWFPFSPRPIKAVRLTSGWVLKTASQGIVNRAFEPCTTRCDFRPQNQIRPAASR